MAMKVPNVRVIAVCDEAVPSEMEGEVFTPGNTRYYAVAESLPHARTLHVYLLLYCDSPGEFSGVILLGLPSAGRLIRYTRFQATFGHAWRFEAMRIGIDECVFPEPGHYSLEVKFMDEDLVEYPRADSQILLLEENDE